MKGSGLWQLQVHPVRSQKVLSTSRCKGSGVECAHLGVQVFESSLLLFLQSIQGSLELLVNFLQSPHTSVT